MNLQAPDPGGVKSSTEMPLLSTRPPSGEVAFSSPASTAQALASPWPPDAVAEAGPSSPCPSGGCRARCRPVASRVALAEGLPCDAPRFSLRDSGLAIRPSLEDDDDDPAAAFPSAMSLACALRPPEAFLVSFLRGRPWPPAPLFFSARWKMDGTAVGLSRRCWSSSLLEKLSLVKCSLQRKEYLVGVQLSL